MKKAIMKVQHDDQRINLMQDRFVEGLEAALSSELLDSIILSNVVLVSGDNTISHRLGRVLKGWIVTRISAAVSLYDRQTTNTIPDRTLVINASGGATVDLLVF